MQQPETESRGDVTEGLSMRAFSYSLLILHFFGLALGLSVSIANVVMLGVIAKAAPNERGVLARFLPAMSGVGRIGLALLWVTGFAMLYTRWNGFNGLPWTFHVKLAAVVVLTIAVTYLARLERRVQRGDASAAPQMRLFGGLATLSAVTAVVFAVLTFD